MCAKSEAEQLFGFGATPARRIRGPPFFREILIQCEDPDPDSEQLFGFGPAPKRPGHLLHEQPSKSGRNTPMIPRSRGPMSSPTPIPRPDPDPDGPDPEQFFWKTPKSPPPPPARGAQWDLVGFTLY